MPFGNHWWDLLPLVVLALLFFGPKRLPEIGSSIGKTIKEFQKSMREVKEPDATALPAQTAAQLPQANVTQTAVPSATPTASTTATTPTAANVASTETQQSEVGAS